MSPVNRRHRDDSSGGSSSGPIIYSRSRNSPSRPGAPLTISGGAASPSNLHGFSEGLLSIMQDALRDLVDVSRARCALVIDRTGCILSSAGDFHPINPSTMGAMAAGTIAALNSMVSRASSPEVSVKFYGGEVDRIHFLLIEDRLALCMLHGRQATSGQIRAAARAFLQRVSPELNPERPMSVEDTGHLRNAVHFIESKLDEMFMD
jgi:predicted regulator of Ras-like GTPase activity (Roadblock/LC7/MglB family)